MIGVRGFFWLSKRRGFIIKFMLRYLQLKTRLNSSVLFSVAEGNQVVAFRVSPFLPSPPPPTGVEGNPNATERHPPCIEAVLKSPNDSTNTGSHCKFGMFTRLGRSGQDNGCQFCSNSSSDLTFSEKDHILWCG